MKKKVIKFNIRSNEGYSVEQVLGRNNLTVGELKSMLEDYDDDCEIVTYDLNNERGASWGLIENEYPDEIHDGDYDY